MDASTQTRTERRKEAIKQIVLANLTVKQVRAMRKEYTKGAKTIADISREFDVPPVLTWAALTPLYEKSHVKLQLLQRETRIYELLRHGRTQTWIAKTLLVSEKEVRNYTSDQFAEHVFHLRPWYNNRLHSQDNDDDVDKYAQLTGDFRPPTSYLGNKFGELVGIPKEELGRCPTCGRLGRIPCYECALKQYLKDNKVGTAKALRPEEDTDERLPQLLFR